MQRHMLKIFGSQKLYNGVISNDKTIKLYENFYHEILNEPEKEKVMKEIQ